MTAPVYYLPDDLIKHIPVSRDEVVIRHYQSGNDSIKNRIVLNSNMINLVMSGIKTVVYPQQTTVINEGELVLLSTGNILTSEVISTGDTFNSILLYFNNDVLNRFLIKYEHLLTTPSNQQTVQPFVTYRQDSFISHFAHSLLHLLNSSHALSPEIKQLKLEELLLYLLRLDASKFQSLKFNMKEEAELLLKKTVESHIGQIVTVDELAFLCNMSASTFKRKFERLYHTSPQKWLLKEKLQRAAELLKSLDETPSNVYHKVGYQNHSSFSQAFRQQFGITPSDYQLQYLSDRRQPLNVRP